MRLQDLRSAFERGELSKRDYFERMQAEHSHLADYAELLPKTGLRSINITDGTTVFTTRAHGIQIECDPRDIGTPPVVAINLGDYETQDGAMLLALVDDGMTFFDVGANLGWYGLHVAKLFPNCQVFAFEPVPRTFSFLERNVAHNAAANMRFFPFGLFSENDERAFSVDPFSSGAASAAAMTGVTGEQQQCAVRKMDDVVAELGIEKLDYIKADVEGAELFVFQGGIKTITRSKPIIFAEMLRKHAATFGYHPNAIIELLRGVGYGCFVCNGDGLSEFREMTEQTVETNFVFLHPEKHREKIARRVSSR
jgi:FkbM family methyltransferase